MKKLALLLVTLLPLLAWGDFSAHGPYIGGQLGYVDPHNPQTTDVWVDAVLPFISKSGSRGYVGYRFNDSFAVEAGYDGLVHKTITSSISSRHAKISGFDLAGKIIVPVRYGFSVYLKGGAARLHQKIYNTLMGVPSYQNNIKKILPLAGAGVGFNFTKSLNVDLSATRIFGAGAIKKLDFFALGATYTLNLQK